MWRLPEAGGPPAARKGFKNGEKKIICSVKVIIYFVCIYFFLFPFHFSSLLQIASTHVDFMAAGKSAANPLHSGFKHA